MKKIITSFLSLIFTCLTFSFAFTRTAIFTFFSQSFIDKVSVVRYYNGPDINPQKGMGFFVFYQVINLDGNNPAKINLDGNTINCYGKLQGWYVNLMRGNYIIPIHTSGLGWKVDGGLYTKCEGYTGGIFGQIFFSQYGYTGSITAGFKMNLADNQVLFNKGFKNWFVLYNGVYPIGFIYDNIGGVAFVGGDISNKSLSNIDIFFKSDENLLTTIKSVDANKILLTNRNRDSWEISRVVNAIVDNIIGVVGSYSVSEDNFASDVDKLQTLQSLGVNKLDKTGKTRYGSIAGKNIDFATVVNKVRKNVEKICKGRWENINNSYFEINKLDSINCIDTNGLNSEIYVNFDPSLLYYSPVLIVRGGENKIIFKKPMIGKNYVEVYNDKGFILVDNGITLVPIDGNGNYNPVSPVTSGALLRGIFIVNGLFGGWNGGSISIFPHKLYIHGTLVSLNTISEPMQTRKKYLLKLIGISDSDKINLSKIFSWRCNPDGTGTDGVNCSNPSDRWYNNSLIFIREYIYSKLLR